MGKNHRVPLTMMMPTAASAATASDANTTSGLGHQCSGLGSGLGSGLVWLSGGSRREGVWTVESPSKTFRYGLADTDSPIRTRRDGLYLTDMPRRTRRYRLADTDSPSHSRIELLARRPAIRQFFRRSVRRFIRWSVCRLVRLLCTFRC